MSAIGRAGLLVGAPLRVLKFKGDQGLNLFGHPGGTSEKEGTDCFRALRPQNRFWFFREGKLQPGDLSETAGAEAKAEA
jgi:hypothetical protein